jgi:hypothetical protein
MGHREVAQLLIAKGASTEAKDELGYTPLHEAAHRGQSELTELLLAAHADVNAENRLGWAPLHLAASNGDLREVQLLIRGGANADAKRAFPGAYRDWSPLDWKKAADQDGKSPRYFALRDGHREAAEFLRQHEKGAEGCHPKAARTLGDTGPNGGVIFDLNESGLHGLEANAKDGGSETWSKVGEALARSGGGRLPNVRELKLLFSMKKLVGGFEDVFYWSSEVGSAVSFKSGAEAELRAFHDSYRGIDAARVRGIHDF